MAITVLFKHLILQQPKATKIKIRILNCHIISSLNKYIKRANPNTYRKTSFSSSTNSSFPYESKLPQKLCKKVSKKERFLDADLFLFPKLSEQPNKGNQKKKKRKEKPFSPPTIKPTKLHLSLTHSLSLSLHQLKWFTLLQKNNNQTHKTSHKKQKEREQKRESWTWIEGSEEKTWALTNFKRKENKKGVFLLQGLCVFFVVCVWQCKKIDGTWLFVKLGFNVFLSFWIRERSFSSFLSFYARE